MPLTGPLGTLVTFFDIFRGGLGEECFKTTIWELLVFFLAGGGKGYSGSESTVDCVEKGHEEGREDWEGRDSGVAFGAFPFFKLPSSSTSIGSQAMSDLHSLSSEAQEASVSDSLSMQLSASAVFSVRNF